MILCIFHLFNHWILQCPKDKHNQNTTLYRRQLKILPSTQTPTTTQRFPDDDLHHLLCVSPKCFRSFIRTHWTWHGLFAHMDDDCLYTPGFGWVTLSYGSAPGEAIRAEKPQAHKTRHGMRSDWTDCRKIIRFIQGVFGDFKWGKNGTKEASG